MPCIFVHRETLQKPILSLISSVSYLEQNIQLCVVLHLDAQIQYYLHISTITNTSKNIIFFFLDYNHVNTINHLPVWKLGRSMELLLLILGIIWLWFLYLKYFHDLPSFLYPYSNTITWVQILMSEFTS